jgi:hypothetical protein
MNIQIRKRFPLMNQEGGEGGGGGAAAPASAPAAQATAAAPAPAPAAPAAAPAPAVQHPWLQTPDTNLIGLAQTKGWQTAADAVKSYHELEKMVGADRAGRTVTIPTDENDKAGWEQVFNRLGRPATAEAYQLPVPQGADPSFARAAQTKFHELGLSEKTGKALAEWWNAQATSQAEAQAIAAQNALAVEHQALEKDWGTGADATARRELARRAAVQLGLDEQSMDALEKVTGYSKVLKALAKVGDMMREHGAEGMSSTNVGSFGMTPEGAKARKSQLMADKEWAKKAMDPKSTEWAELKKLDGIISAAADRQAA